MKKMIFGIITLLIFLSLRGMRQNAINSYYKNKRPTFSELTKNQRATLMLMICESPTRAVEKLNDLKGNNVLHFILSSHGKFTNEFVIEVFRLCWSHGADELLDRQNTLGKSPSDLIGDSESLGKFYGEYLKDARKADKTAIVWECKKYDLDLSEKEF